MFALGNALHVKTKIRPLGFPYRDISQTLIWTDHGEKKKQNCSVLGKG
jgi:hypothetical protein